MALFDKWQASGTSHQKVMRFKQPHHLRGPLASLRHPSGVSEGEGLR
jgi:hypothetical protein